MELRHYASILWRWAWLIVLCTVLAAGAGFAFSNTQPKVYESSTRLLVNQAETLDRVGYQDILTSQQLTKTFSELLRTRPVLENALADLGLQLTPEQFGRTVRVQAVRDTMLLTLTASSTDPKHAADAANAVASAFIKENRKAQLGAAADSRSTLQAQLDSLDRDIKSTSDQIDRLRSASASLTPEARQSEISRLQATLSQYQLTYTQLLKSEQEMRLAESKAYSSLRVVEPAGPSVDPVSPKTAQNTLLAALIGLMLAVGYVVVTEYLDDTVKTGDDVQQALGAPALGFVGRFKRRKGEGNLTLIEMGTHSPAVEAFRILRTNIDFTMLDRPGKAILVTSAAPGEGKTTTTVNLAQVMAQAGRRVILVDADLRRPSVHRWFDLRNDAGLTTALLSDQLSLPGALRSGGMDNLQVITSGPIPPNPAEILGSPRMARLVEELRGMADVVLFDCPPALAVSDPTILSGRVDGVLVVVDSARTRAGALDHLAETLERAGSGEKILGAVLNKLSSRSGGYYYTYQRYGYGPDQRDGENGHHGKAELRSAVNIGYTGDAE